MPTCTVCGTEMKLVPAGVSKTSGKPYNAFYSCPNRCPKPRTYSAPKPDFNQTMEKKSELIQQAQDRKEVAIREAGDRSIAGQIVAAAINSNQLQLNDWQFMFDEIYSKLHSKSVGKRSEPEPTENIPFPIE